MGVWDYRKALAAVEVIHGGARRQRNLDEGVGDTVHDPVEL